MDAEDATPFRSRVGRGTLGAVRPVRCDYCGREAPDVAQADEDEWLSVTDHGSWDFCSIEHLALWSEAECRKQLA